MIDFSFHHAGMKFNSRGQRPRITRKSVSTLKGSYLMKGELDGADVGQSPGACGFFTKNRIDLITPEIELELFAYVGGILKNNDSRLLDAGGTANHVHLLISQSKNIALSALLKDVKKDSSRWIKTKDRLFKDFHWQDGYAAFSIGESNVLALKRYIANQKAHHHQQTFQEELVEILKKYKVEYDEHYLWD